MTNPTPTGAAEPALPEPFALSISHHPDDRRGASLVCRLYGKDTGRKEKLFTADQMRAYRAEGEIELRAKLGALDFAARSIAADRDELRVGLCMATESLRVMQAERDELRAKLEATEREVAVWGEELPKAQAECDRLRAELEAIRAQKPVRTEWKAGCGTWQRAFTDFSLQVAIRAGHQVRHLYAGPVAAAGPAEPLTPEQIEAICAKWGPEEYDLTFLARAIEAAHGIGAIDSSRCKHRANTGMVCMVHCGDPVCRGPASTGGA